MIYNDKRTANSVKWRCNDLLLDGINYFNIEHLHGYTRQYRCLLIWVCMLFK